MPTKKIIPRFPVVIATPMPETNHHYDILIAGAGFAGSLTALILHNAGYKVVLVERGQHPRFAIGESSTPVADMILRDLSVKHNLPWLQHFSRYGSWQLSHPEIVCGLKRGFSFFKHFPYKEFSTDDSHTNELLVAASTDNVRSDTNWLRADFDAFLVNKVKESGITYSDLTEITSAIKTKQWEFKTQKENATNTIEARFFIDATGSGNLLNNLLGVSSSASDFLTNSFAVFSHFNNVPEWSGILKKEGISTDDFPYDPDNSAVHHVMDDGWMWVLRFNDKRTSIGIVLDGHKNEQGQCSAEGVWNSTIDKYPALSQMLANATLTSIPGNIIQTPRMQRKTEACCGPGWAVLPNTAGFVDPLFSPGIAHSLCGVEKLTDRLCKFRNDPNWADINLKDYEYSIFEELKLIDMLIAGCYLCIPHFKLFNAWSMLYFAATIAYEQGRLKGEAPEYFLNAGDVYITTIVNKSYADLLAILNSGQPTTIEIDTFTNLIRERIKLVNIAGLLDPSAKNMYRHTTAAL
ncbi:NAD(P)/FAD-dependent oxidoreductase [Mucilaginibacter segetis]|uniref:Tryptophan 7-halogenase n=1 Tax=Mucilaginibacter segetis TaxID=2793071 RepID=A0A934ULJ9_9SPHI|nr:tryptophan 7-halogenase [Mucilaginibacter segetis]MBK0378429.1 tryptophan 7-halogenase [Mucilaginibacter segetis]